MAATNEYMLYVGSHGMDDPTRAGLIFAAARGAIKAGYGAKVALLGDAVLLMNDDIAKSTILAGPGRGSVYDIMAEIRGKVEIHC